jgi:hypothetical protein
VIRSGGGYVISTDHDGGSAMEREQPAQPEQPEPETPEEELEPDFARGVRTGPESDAEKKGRFSEGIEQTPETPEEELEPDFARGVRTGPESDAEKKGRFSEGVEGGPTNE